jgi:hypothetical protein
MKAAGAFCVGMFAPISTITPSRTARSPKNRGTWVPSISVPFLITRAYPPTVRSSLALIAFDYFAYKILQSQTQKYYKSRVNLCAAAEITRKAGRTPLQSSGQWQAGLRTIALMANGAAFVERGVYSFCTEYCVVRSGSRSTAYAERSP